MERRPACAPLVTVLPWAPKKKSAVDDLVVFQDRRPSRGTGPQLRAGLDALATILGAACSQGLAALGGGRDSS
ncbi:MAG: hypothetical protein IPK78_03285 [Rhodospirillales bacterium]|nr:hypothetical protein [Rhodospirillales bacterium]